MVEEENLTLFHTLTLRFQQSAMLKMKTHDRKSKRYENFLFINLFSKCSVVIRLQDNLVKLCVKIQELF